MQESLKRRLGRIVVLVRDELTETVRELLEVNSADTVSWDWF